MERREKISIYGFGAIIIILWLTILVLDWSRLLFYSTTLNSNESLISKSLKLLLSFIIALFVWTRESNTYLNKRDSIFLKSVFFLFFIAEIFFYIKNTYIGIGIFSLAQLIFIIRNSSGILMFIKSKDIVKDIPKIFTIVCFVLLVTIILLFKIFLPKSSNPLFTIMIVYAVFLSASTIVGLLTPIIGYFPLINSCLIVIGTLIFYIGDVTVGLNLLLPVGLSYIISSSLTWLFYLPSIVLFALSGMDLKKV